MLGTKIFATIVNAVSGLFLLAALTENAFVEGAQLSIVLFFAAGMLVTLVAVWRSPGRWDKPFGMMMRGIRILTWGFHGVLMAVIMACAFVDRQPWLLLVLLPSLLVYAILHQKPLPPSAMGLFDRGDNEATERRKLSDYYAEHKVEIDALDKACCRLLIDLHFVRDEIVGEGMMQIKDLPHVPYAAISHLRGDTAEIMAIDVAEVLRHSYGDNNPQIFTKHMDTGEVLPPDYEYDSWRHDFLGHSHTQKIISLVILLLVGCSVYGFFHRAYLMSESWGFTSIGISLGLAILFCRHRLECAAVSDLRTRREQLNLKKLDMIWFFPVVVGFCWLMMADGVGTVLTQAFGQPYEAAYYYEKSHGKMCLTIYADFWSIDEFCLNEAEFARLPSEGRAVFAGKKAWFGESLEYMQPDVGSSYE